MTCDSQNSPILADAIFVSQWVTLKNVFTKCCDQLAERSWMQNWKMSVLLPTKALFINQRYLTNLSKTDE